MGGRPACPLISSYLIVSYSMRAVWVVEDNLEASYPKRCALSSSHLVALTTSPQRNSGW